MEIRADNPMSPHAAALLAEHVADVTRHAPRESCHAMPAAALSEAGVSFWTVWDGQTLVGCGALKELDARHGEIKSMRTVASHRRRGAGAAMLEHVLAVARARGYERLSLETGAQEAFVPARSLYARFGFERCGPFGGYREDANSVFMTRGVDGEAVG
ncbi:MAG: GNAT family N-acetyltransferase [Phycisphaeraceae bacterium]|nr:MAG: GNAT family N-acetyltransferase [Phycisphaeraceae bacterium]